MRRNPATRFIVAGGVVLWMSTAAPAQHSRYQMTVLDPADPASTVCPCFFPQDISDGGRIAGFFFGADGNYNAFVQSGTGMMDISPPGDNRTFARAINNAGQVVGWTNAFSFQDAFYYDGSTLVTLPPLQGEYGDARDINNNGDVVGDSDDRATLWRNLQPTNLGVLPDGFFSDAMAINDNGLIVGNSWDVNRDIWPVYWNPDLSGPFIMQTIPGEISSSAVNDVNNAGKAVGTINLVENSVIHTHAVVWDNVTAEPVDLGLLPEASDGMSIYGGPALVDAAAVAVNSAGVVVGMTSPPVQPPMDRHGPFVSIDGSMRNLNDLVTIDHRNWIITDIAGISDDGVIAATAFQVGTTHGKAVLLTPVTNALADLDGSGHVNVNDLFELLSAWGSCGATCPADLNGDRSVNVVDLFEMLSEWSN